MRYYTTLYVHEWLDFRLYTVASFPVVLLRFPEHSGFVSSEATDPLTDETPPGPDETVRIRIYRRV